MVIDLNDIACVFCHNIQDSPEQAWSQITQTKAQLGGTHHLSRSHQQREGALFSSGNQEFLLSSDQAPILYPFLLLQAVLHATFSLSSSSSPWFLFLSTQAPASQITAHVLIDRYLLTLRPVLQHPFNKIQQVVIFIFKLLPKGKSRLLIAWCSYYLLQLSIF